MKKIIFLLLLFPFIGFAQETNPEFDEKLAKSLNADDYGMKTYVFCILKTGSNTTATKEEKAKLFEGHMANINKLAAEGKLVVAGPFMKNDRNYRGVFVFNVSTIEEANALVESDPAVKAKIFEAEMTIWYCSAALQQVNQLHNKVAKKKM
ncbi:YciI family protein [Flavobacterium sp. UBA7682]|uniref:YciI family protein n=1 Tax=Flavobacterium sp. UBA7682 TaxID=1946560 RepID=UPI0025C075FC|nr:YciI family protein [Flavobacterium sp. UBA7682]